MFVPVRKMNMASNALKGAITSQQKTEAVRKSYRELYRLIQRLDPSQQQKSIDELRSSYRKDIEKDEDVDSLLHEAGKKIAYLRIVTPKKKPSSDSGRWIYKNGEVMSDENATARNSGRVVSNWNGSNLDPCSVKRHNQQLKRAGFVNNLHAKGIF